MILKEGMIDFGIRNMAYRFDMLSFGKNSKKQHIGNKENGCRFCSACNDKAKFTKIAHSIPEGLGNRLLFCNEECDNCNDHLSRVENNLIYSLDIRRSYYHIRSKKHSALESEGLNFVIRRSLDDPTRTTLYIKCGSILPEEEDIKLRGSKIITKMGIYKALCKIVVDLIPNNEVSHFKTTVRWINSRYSDIYLPSLYYSEGYDPIQQPYVYLFFNHGRMATSPYCTALLRVIDVAYLFVVPFIDKDGNDYRKDTQLKQHWELVLSMFRQYWVKKDFSSNYPVRKVDKISKKGHYIPSSEVSDLSIFAPKHNPKEKFPQFDESQIKISSVDFSFPSNFESDVTIEEQDKYGFEMNCGVGFLISVNNVGLTVRISVDFVTSRKIQILKRAFDVHFIVNGLKSQYKVDKKGNVFFCDDLRLILFNKAILVGSQHFDSIQKGTQYEGFSLIRLYDNRDVILHAKYKFVNKNGDLVDPKDYIEE
jgi:hypothetical protein